MPTVANPPSFTIESAPQYTGIPALSATSTYAAIADATVLSFGVKNASTSPAREEAACATSAVPVIVASLYFKPCSSQYSLARSIPVTELISLVLYTKPKVLASGVSSCASSNISSMAIALETPVIFLSVLLKSPVTNGTISSSFGERDGKFHQGLDIAADIDTPITASLTGTVKEAGENDSYGKYVLLDHGSGIETRYAHCNSISVKQGDHVNMGDEIAKVGSTGDSSGPHVHLELLIDGTPYNPQTVLQK